MSPKQVKLPFGGRPAKTDKAGIPVPHHARDSANSAGASGASASQTSPLSPPSNSDFDFLPLDKAMEQLPDSTDWIRTSLTEFEPLEAALRCEVCKEFYENPVITTCSHTFCSLCIRRCLSHDGQCPACRSKCQADKLIANVTVREIVSRFRHARPRALELAKQSNDPTPSAGSKKRKQDEAGIGDSGSQRVTRARLARSSSQRGNGMPNSPLEVADSEDDGDGDFVPDELPEGMAACPQCNKAMKLELVWPHIGPGGDCPGEAGHRRVTTR